MKHIGAIRDAKVRMEYIYNSITIYSLYNGFATYLLEKKKQIYANNIFFKYNRSRKSFDDLSDDELNKIINC